MPDVPAKVTQATPLRVMTEGATKDCPAVGLNGATYTVEQRVTITVRNPQVPIIQGEETT